MNDDREVRCYTLAMEHDLGNGVDMAQRSREPVASAARDADDGCAAAAEQHFDRPATQPQPTSGARPAWPWKTHQPRVATQAVGMVCLNAEWARPSAPC